MPFPMDSGNILLGKGGPINVESRNVPLRGPLRRNGQLTLWSDLAVGRRLAAANAMISIIALMLTWCTSQLLPDQQCNEHNKCASEETPGTS